MAPTTTPIGILYCEEQKVYKAQKALVAAKFNGIVMTEAKFDPERDARKPNFLAKNPTGKVPYLETDMGCIFTSNAIARYVARCRADTFIYGKCFDDEAQIDTWLEVCIHELEVPLMSWVYPVLGVMKDDPQATKAATNDVKQVMTSLEKQLTSSPFLIGDFLTLADIVFVCALSEGFARIFDPSFRKPYPQVCSWFEKCRSLPQFQAVLGEVKLCTQAEKPKPVQEPAAKPAKAEAKLKADAKPKAEAKPKVEAKPKAEAKAKAEAKTSPAAVPSGDQEAAITAVGNQLRALKEKLKTEGLSGKKVNEHEEVKKLVEQLVALKAGAPAPASAPAAAASVASPAAPAGDVEAAIKAIGDEIRTLKEKLKSEGLSSKKINEHGDIKKLVDKIQALKAQLPQGGTPAVAPPGTAAASAPAATAAGGDVETMIKATGDEIRTLKDKLKKDGLKGKELNNHPDVQKLVAQLTELKAKQ